MNEKTFSLNDKQHQFHADKGRIRAFLGGAGAGKTFIGCLEAYVQAAENPGTLGIISRYTYRELSDSTRRVFFEVVPPEAIKSFNKTENQVELWAGDGSQVSTILFRSLDDPQKIGWGINLGFAYIDEAAELPNDEMFLLLQTRLRAPEGPRKMWLTSNPPDEAHWIHQWFVKNRPEDYSLIHASIYDNQANLPPDYITNLEASFKKRPQWARRYLEGQFGTVVVGEPVYQSYEDGWHLSEKPLTWHADKLIYRGWDFGFHRPACIWAQLDEDRTFKVLREKMGNMIYLQDFAKQVVEASNEWFPGCRFRDYCDPSGVQRRDTTTLTSIDILRQVGIEALYRRAPISVGIELLDRQLRLSKGGKPAFLLDPRCDLLRNGFLGGYHYGMVKTGTILKDEPASDGYYEHPFDALRYLVINLLSPFSGQDDTNFKIPSIGTGVGYAS